MSQKAVFRVSQMDCPSEEQLIRMQFARLDQVRALHVDLALRRLEVFFEGETKPVQEALAALKLGEELLSVETVQLPATSAQMHADRQMLTVVLAINASLFVVEALAGWWSSSMGLWADSLDMLADAIVYGLSLYAVGSTALRQRQIARLSGYFQFVLALGGLSEVIRRTTTETTLPLSEWMMLISLIALAANVWCLYLLRGATARHEAVHLHASWIFTANDVLANIGVIVAGLLVWWLDHPWPDMVVGLIIFVLVCRGALNILRLAGSGS